ncbi:MAG: hypothetical protein OEV06_09500 [Anaerolineae bacterium]|nr:hypothetical protein [Anaerolineae bacterium]
MRRKLLMMLGTAAILLACNIGPLLEEATPEEDEGDIETQVAEGVQQTAQARGAVETSAAEVMELTATFEAAATRAADIAAEVQETATEEAQPFADILWLIDELYDKGYINGTDGDVELLGDFDESFNERDYFRRYPSGSSPYDFVFHAVVTLRSNETNTATVAGCGIVIRKTNNTTGNYVLLDFRGNARYGRITPDFWSPQGMEKNVFDANRSIEVIVVVEGSRYYLLLDREQVLRQSAVTSSGEIHYMIAAGSVPMRCQFEDVWVWELE